MAQPSFSDNVRPEPGLRTIDPILAETLASIRGLQLYCDVSAQPPQEGEWVTGADLASPASAPLSALMGRFQSHGFAPNKKAASASLLLRVGWAGGFAIASYLACRRVPYLGDYAMNFSPNTLLRAVWVQDAYFEGQSSESLTKRIAEMPDDIRRARLLDSLIAFTEPVLAAQHAWSGFSRHALWAMVTSSWAGQFAAVARQLGDTDLGAREAQAMFALNPEIAHAAPELYDVRAGDMVCTCQRRAACCLYFKTPGRNFCASCPIIAVEERLARNQSWVVAQQRSSP
jgi:hypothetical protein